MIGRVVAQAGEAEMGDDGVWASSSPDLALFLNAFHLPESGLSVLPFGRGAVADAAVALGGRAEYTGAPALVPPGCVS